MSKSKRNAALLRRLLLTGAAIILGFTLYKWNAQSLMGNQLPMPFGYGLSVVLSGSMEPTLEPNDLVIVRETDSIQVGSIVVYQSRDSLIIHRVIQISGDSLITRGDANNTADAPIHRKDVKGEAVAILPQAGAVVQFMKQPAVLAGMLLAIVVLTEMSYRREKQEDHQELAALEDEIRQLMDEIKSESKE